MLFVALVGGWSWFWHYAAGKAEATVDAWRAREAKAGRVYTCGTQTVGGYPFRIEVDCDQAVGAVLRSNQPPVELKTPHILAAVQVYDPTLMISEFTGPLTIAEPGHAPTMIATLEADAVERARHAGGAAAGLDRVRPSQSRPRR